MALTLPFLAVLGPVALLAGVVRGFAGFGGPLVMLPCLTAFMPPSLAIPLVMWIDLMVNVRLVPEAATHMRPAVVFPITTGLLLTMPLGVAALVHVDPVLMKRCVSAAILVAAVVLLSGWHYKGRINKPGWVGIGMLTGLIMGATSLAISAALFFQADRQSATEARANFIFCMFFGSVMLLAMLAYGQGFDWGLLPAIAILAPLYFVGTLGGSYLCGRLPDLLVRRAVLLLVIAVATVGLVL